VDLLDSSSSRATLQLSPTHTHHTPHTLLEETVEGSAPHSVEFRNEGRKLLRRDRTDGLDE